MKPYQKFDSLGTLGLFQIFNSPIRLVTTVLDGAHTEHVSCCRNWIVLHWSRERNKVPHSISKSFKYGKNTEPSLRIWSFFFPFLSSSLHPFINSSLSSFLSTFNEQVQWARHYSRVRATEVNKKDAVPALRHVTINDGFRWKLAIMIQCDRCYVTPNLVWGPQAYTEKGVSESWDPEPY